MEASERKAGWAWASVPRVVWLTAAGFGIAVASAGAAMWLAPGQKKDLAADEAIIAPVAKVTAPKPAAKREPATAEAKPVCATCGVVESVQAVTKKGEGTGLGAVAGGVVGGALGNQVGDGNGRKAMTVLGAVGGGFAGHEIEKRARSQTAYTVKVRMDDGTLRTLTQTEAPAVGARVTVQGSTLRLAQKAGASGG